MLPIVPQHTPNYMYFTRRKSSSPIPKQTQTHIHGEKGREGKKQKGESAIGNDKVSTSWHYWVTSKGGNRLINRKKKGGNWGKAVCM